MKKYKKAKKIKYGYFILIFVVSILTIGFSAFETELNVNDISAVVRVKKDIRISNVVVENIAGNAETTYTDYNVDRMLVGVKLPEATSSIKYKVTLTNLGNVEIGLFSIDNLPSNLTYVLENYTLKDKICDNNGKCSLGVVKEFYVTIKYKDTSNVSDKIYDLNLIFNLQPFYKITYTNMKVLPTYCKAATTLTTGFRATNSFKPGEEYRCEVKPGATYNFFVLSTEGDKINLILDRNIGIDGVPTDKYISINSPVNGLYTTSYWLSDSTYGCGVNGTKCATYEKGPLTALAYLNTALSSWTNIENLNESYTDEGGNYGTIKLTGKGRLPKLSEFYGGGANCDLYAGSCPLWFVNYLADNYHYEGRTDVPNMFGFWTMSTKSSKIYSWSVGASGDVGGSTIYIGYSHGIRPVISITKKTPYQLGYRTEVLGKDTLSLSLGSPVPITVKVNGVTTTNYTYNNGVLTLPNVTGNVEIIQSS